MDFYLWHEILDINIVKKLMNTAIKTGANFNSKYGKKLTDTAIKTGNANLNKELTLKNNAPLISCISKINGELVESAEDLDIVMPMYNLLEHSKKYEKTSGSFFNYYRDEPK